MRKGEKVSIDHNLAGKKCLSMSLMLEGGACFSLQSLEVPAKHQAEYDALAEGAKKLAAKIKGA